LKVSDFNLYDAHRKTILGAVWPQAGVFLSFGKNLL